MSKADPNIADLVRNFRAHIREYKSPDTKEAAIRQQFIDPFWRLLGWDVGDTKGVGPTRADVIIEKSVNTIDVGGLRYRRPDYLFRLGGFARFIVEAKKPSVDLDADLEAIYQAKQYAWNSTIPFAILTDFEQFRLYDTTLKPIHASPARGLVTEFKLDYDDYEAQWDTIASTFGREAVESGSLEKLLASIKKVKAGRRIRTVDRMLIDLRGGEPVDKAFLGFLEVHRSHLAASIYRANKGEFPEANTLHGAARLTEAVQRIMDRIVFMRVMEDRGITHYGALRDMLERIRVEGGDFYVELCHSFRGHDRDYNGYLYKAHFSEELTVDGAVLADFVRTLYPPEGPWDFAAIGDDILGTVYERFLGNTIVVKSGRAEVEEKLEVRHAGGVYYTPRFVVDSIIRRVIGPKIEGRTPEEVLDVKILDPACGSGSFLVAALQFLFDHCLAAVTADPAVAKALLPAPGEPGKAKKRRKRAEIAFKDDEDRWHLSPDFRAALLTNCIHGIDIDQQAVEVTVMSLYLKMLESRLPKNWQREWIENQLLPTLDNNIRCGNSLIDHADYDHYLEVRKKALFGEDEDTKFRINRFDWKSRTHGFGRVLDVEAAKARGRSGFDCIIGNPPYIRVQELNKWAPEECEFYKWKYKSAEKGNYDIYVVFTERALSLLAKDGLLGFIMPHKFWQAKYGEGLRKLIAEGRHLKAVVDFVDQQVFNGATTYTAIHVFKEAPSDTPVDYAKVATLEDGRSQCADLDAGKEPVGTARFPSRHPSGDESWVFANEIAASLMQRLASQGRALGEVATKIFVGLQTSADSVFILERRGKRLWSEQLGCAVDMEPAYLHPLLKGSVHMKRWLPIQSEQVVLFPYEEQDGKYSLVAAEKIERSAPLTWDYLLQCRPFLAARERGTFEGGRWYGYVYPKNLASMAVRKILTPSLGQRAEYCLDSDGSYYFVGSGGGGGGGYGILLPENMESEYVVGLLNSRLLDWFLQQITTPFHSGWFAYNKQFISQVPIKIPETTAEKKLADRITESVQAIMNAKKALRKTGLSDRERGSLESAIEAHEARIDEAVFALYGVDSLPGD